MDMTPPSWLAELRDDPELSEALELTWLDEEQSPEVRSRFLETWDQIPFVEGFHQACRARLERSVPLAIGTRRYRRLSRSECALVLLLDPERPEQPWVGLSRAMPPALWVRGAPTGPGLRRRLAPYLVPQPPPLAELGRTLRIAKPIEVDDPSLVTRVIEGYEPWMDDATWASGHADDPWADLEPELDMLTMHVMRQRSLEEHPGRFPSTGFRSLWSRSAMIIQRMPSRGWVFELRYQPADDAQTLRELEAQLGEALPAHDLPVDLVASILRGGTLLPQEVDRHCEDDPQAMHAKVSTEPAEPTSFALLERWMQRSHDDPGLLPALAELASGHGFDALLFELALRLPPDDALRRELEDVLRPQRPQLPLEEGT